MERPTIMNELEKTLAIGLIECQVQQADQLVLNSTYIIVANHEYIEVSQLFVNMQILSSVPNPENPTLSILIERILVVEFM